MYQYSETNVMHFLFSLLRIKDLYMFQALLAHLLHKQHLVYCMCVMSVGNIPRNIPNGACGAPPEDEQVMLETCRGP
jgi:hypothetical protein